MNPLVPLCLDRRAFGLEIKAVLFFHFVESPPGYSPKQPQNKDCGDRPGQNRDPEAILRKAGEPCGNANNCNKNDICGG